MTEEGLGLRHQRVQRLRRLARQKSTREHEGAFLVEGAKLLGCALQAGVALEGVYYDPAAESDATALAVLETARRSGVRAHRLAPGVLARVADAVTPQPVLAVARTLDVGLEEVVEGGRVLVLVDVRDPGNLGAILRVAEASGFSGVVSCTGSGDLYNPKTVRASAGALFFVKVATGADPLAALGFLARSGFRRLATVARGGEDYDAADLEGRVALVFGNEANGLSPELFAHLDGALTVPLLGHAESLNVATAAAVLCFEVDRRRRAGAGAGLSLYR